MYAYKIDEKRVQRRRLQLHCVNIYVYMWNRKNEVGRYMKVLNGGKGMPVATQKRTNMLNI